LDSLDEKSSNKLQYPSGSYKSITVAIVLTSVIYTAIFSWTLFIRNNKHEFERLAVNQSKTSQQVSDQYWSPELFGATEIRFNKYQADNEHAVDYYTAYYKFNTPSTELVSSKNRIYDPRDWTLKQKTTEKISSATNQINALLYSVVGSNGQYRLILYWYEIGELKTYAPIWIKLYQSIDALFGNPGSGRIVIISAVYREGELNSMKEILFSIARDALASEKV
jgi:EpsI family protein